MTAFEAQTQASARAEETPESVVIREPWVAVLYSLLIPGLGQWYAGAMRNAVLYFIAAMGLLGAGAGVMFWPRGSTVAALVLLGLGLVVFVRGLFDAFDKAATANGERGEAQRKKHKDPWLSVFLSLLIPGSGQIFNLRIPSGVVFLGLWLGATKLEAVIQSSLLTWYLLSLFTAVVGFGACLHAWHSAPGLRPAQSPIRTLAFVVAALVLLRTPTATYLVKKYLAVPVQCRTGSMAPGIAADDRVFAEPAGSRAPERGRVVAFLLPPDAFREPQTGPAPLVIKRIIALPGDTVRTRGGGIEVNGATVAKPGAKTMDLEQLVKVPAPEPDGRDLIVPPMHVYVVGDNLSNSFDSREYGPVPVENLRSYPYKIYWPPEHAGPVK